LIAFFRLLGVNFPIVDSGGKNQLFDRAAAVHSERFFSNPTHTHSITFLGANPGFATVCGALPCFDHDLFHTLLSYMIHFLSPVMRRFKNGSILFGYGYAASNKKKHILLVWDLTS